MSCEVQQWPSYWQLNTEGSLRSRLVCLQIPDTLLESMLSQRWRRLWSSVWETQSNPSSRRRKELIDVTRRKRHHTPLMTQSKTSKAPRCLPDQRPSPLQPPFSLPFWAGELGEDQAEASPVVCFLASLERGSASELIRATWEISEYHHVRCRVCVVLFGMDIWFPETKFPFITSTHTKGRQLQLAALSGWKGAGELLTDSPGGRVSTWDTGTTFSFEDP